MSAFADPLVLAVGGDRVGVAEQDAAGHLAGLVAVGQHDRDVPESEQVGDPAGDRLQGEVELTQAQDIPRDLEDALETPLHRHPSRYRRGPGRSLAADRPSHNATQWALAPPTVGTWRCSTAPDCSAEHDEPGEATLGHHVRCLDCQIEIDLALELRFMPMAQVAA